MGRQYGDGDAYRLRGIAGALRGRSSHLDDGAQGCVHDAAECYPSSRRCGSGTLSTAVLSLSSAGRITCMGMWLGVALAFRLSCSCSGHDWLNSGSGRVSCGHDGCLVSHQTRPKYGSLVSFRLYRSS